VDYLRPWGDASIVINLEMLRIAYAYGNDLRSSNRSMRRMLSQFSGAFEENKELYEQGMKLARFLPDALGEALVAIKGIRFVSRHPHTGDSELLLLADEDGPFHSFLSSFRKDKNDMAGLMPNGLGIQCNFDPSKIAACIKEFAAYYESFFNLDPKKTSKVLAPILRTMAGDEGRYLLGGTLDQKDGVVIFAKAIETEGESKGTDAFISSLLSPLLSKEEVENSQNNGISRSVWSLKGGRNYFFPKVSVATCACLGYQISTVRAQNEKETDQFIDKLVRMCRVGGGKIRKQGIPEKSDLFFKASIGDLLMSGMGALMVPAVSGYGKVEENRLLIKFL